MKSTPIECPYCHCSSLVPNQLIGRQVSCPHCNGLVQTMWNESDGFGGWLKSHWFLVLFSLVFSLWFAYQSYSGIQEREQEQIRLDRKWDNLTVLEKHVFFFMADMAGYCGSIDALWAMVKKDMEAIKARARESEERNERLPRPFWWDEKWSPEIGVALPQYTTPDYLLYKRKGWFEGFEHLAVRSPN